MFGRRAFLGCVAGLLAAPFVRAGRVLLPQGKWPLPPTVVAISMYWGEPKAHVAGFTRRYFVMEVRFRRGVPPAERARVMANLQVAVLPERGWERVRGWVNQSLAGDTLEWVCQEQEVFRAASC